MTDEQTQPTGNKMATLGMIAYDAYCKAAGGRSLVTGATLPGFDALRPEIQAAWEAAALAVKAAI